MAYENLRFDVGFRANMIVGSLLIIELKSFEHVLLNFAAHRIKDGITKVVNRLPDERDSPCAFAAWRENHPRAAIHAPSAEGRGESTGAAITCLSPLKDQAERRGPHTEANPVLACACSVARFA